MKELKLNYPPDIILFNKDDKITSIYRYKTSIFKKY